MQSTDVAPIVEIAASIIFAWSSIMGVIQNRRQNKIFEQQNKIIAAQGGGGMYTPTTEIDRMARYWTVLMCAALAVLTWGGVAYIAHVNHRIWLAIPVTVGMLVILAWLLISRQLQLNRARQFVEAARREVENAEKLIASAKKNLPIIANLELYSDLETILKRRLECLPESTRPLSETVLQAEVRSLRDLPARVYGFRQLFDFIRNRIPALSNEYLDDYAEHTRDQIIESLQVLIDKQNKQAAELRSLIG
jgi:hypothetical protein